MVKKLGAVLDRVGGAGAERSRLVLEVLKKNRIAVLAVTLEGLGLNEEAGDLRECGWKYVHRKCRDCGHEWDTKWRCGLRICPECARFREWRLYKAHKGICGRKNLKHLVLTIKNVEHLTGAVIDELRGFFTKLRRRKIFRKAWKGGVYSIEFTYTKEKGWHVHIHVIFEGNYLPHLLILRVWEEITEGKGKGKRSVDIRRCENARYALKYMLKVDKALLGSPEAVAEFIEATRGKKLTSGWGWGYRVRSLMAKEKMGCPVCGSMWVEGEIVPVVGMGPGPPRLFRSEKVGVVVGGIARGLPLGQPVGNGGALLAQLGLDF